MMNKLLEIFLLFCLSVNLNGQTVSGTVVSELSEPLGGASIWVPHTNIGTVADHKGNYSITIDSNYNTLRYCFIGLECKEVNINKDTIVNITLEEPPTELNELIIKGISVRKRHYHQTRIIERKGWFKKADTILIGMPDSTFSRIEVERTRKILDSMDIHHLNDSINFKADLTSLEKDFRKYLIDSLKYPEVALNKGVSGIVIVKFTINKESKISDIKILRGIDPVIDHEVVAVLENLPGSIQTALGKYGKSYHRQISKKYIFKIRFEWNET